MRPVTSFRTRRPEDRQRGLTLVEVILALTIATVGVCYMQQGLTLCVMADGRRLCYEKCTAFLDQQMESMVVATGAGGQGMSGRVPGDGP
jgi:prepilin-type N-terminal cleavage/methylation domain-containing protein